MSKFTNDKFVIIVERVNYFKLTMRQYCLKNLSVQNYFLITNNHDLFEASYVGTMKKILERCMLV